MIELNHPYRCIHAAEADARLAPIAGLHGSFILHVGSILRRKNRDGLLRIVAKTASAWHGELVIAGQGLSPVLLFLSRFEGFGWPVIEAQACACPVICSRSGPLPEVAGEGALRRDVNDQGCFAADLLRVNDRRHWQTRAQANLGRFTTARMVQEYIATYSEVVSSR